MFCFCCIGFIDLPANTVFCFFSHLLEFLNEVDNAHLVHFLGVHELFVVTLCAIFVCDAHPLLLIDFLNSLLRPDDDLVAIDCIELEIYVAFIITLRKMVLDESTNILANQLFRLGKINVFSCFSS